MKIGLQSQSEFAGEWLFRRFAAFLAKLQIIFDRRMKLTLQALDPVRLKSDDVSQIDHFAVKNLRVFVELHGSNVSFVFHLIILSSWIDIHGIELQMDADRTSLKFLPV